MMIWKVKWNLELTQHEKKEQSRIIKRCRFCNAESDAIFRVEASDEQIIEYSLCIEDALLLQNQGYNVHVKKTIKKVEENEEGKEKEKV